jgi:hypothetical protein
MSGKHHCQCNCIECIAYLEEIADVDLDDWEPSESNLYQMPYAAPITEDGGSRLSMKTDVNGDVETPHEHIFLLGSGDSILENQSAQRLIEPCRSTPITPAVLHQLTPEHSVLYHSYLRNVMIPRTFSYSCTTDAVDPIINCHLPSTCNILPAHICTIP